MVTVVKGSGFRLQEGLEGLHLEVAGSSGGWRCSMAIWLSCVTAQSQRVRKGLTI